MQQSTAVRRNTARRVKKNLNHNRSRLLWKRRMFCLALVGLVLCALFLPLQLKTWRLQAELKQLQSEKQALLQQQQQVQQQIDYYNSDTFVEEAARRGLGLVKPGEALVLPGVPGKTQLLPKNYHNTINGPYGD